MFCVGLKFWNLYLLFKNICTHKNNVWIKILLKITWSFLFYSSVTSKAVVPKGQWNPRTFDQKQNSFERGGAHLGKPQFGSAFGYFAEENWVGQGGSLSIYATKKRNKTVDCKKFVK